MREHASTANEARRIEAGALYVRNSDLRTVAVISFPIKPFVVAFGASLLAPQARANERKPAENQEPLGDDCPDATQ